MTCCSTLAEQRYELHHVGKVVRAGGASEAGRMLGRQPVRPRRRIVLDDPTGGHRSQPFAHVALLGARR